MGGGGSRILTDASFAEELRASIQTSQTSGDFSDLTILRPRDGCSTPNTNFQNRSIRPLMQTELRELLEEDGGVYEVSLFSYYAHKVVVSIAFPKLRELLQTYHVFDTTFSKEVIRNLGTYAYFGKLILDDHLLSVIGALLELLPAEELQKRITAEVGAHVKLLLTDRNVVDTMTTTDMAALVFVAKLHDLDVIELLYDWKVSREARGDGLDDVYLEFMTYLVKSEKGAPLSPHGVPDAGRKPDL